MEADIVGQAPLQPVRRWISLFAPDKASAAIFDRPITVAKDGVREHPKHAREE